MNADPIADIYRWLEYAAFGRTLETCRTAQLPLPVAPDRVVILGEGDGRFLRAFLDFYPRARVDVVDSSGRMIELARRRLSKDEWERVRYLRADALTVRLNEGYDLAVANFFLDCFSGAEVDALLASITAPVWIVGDFQLPAGGWARGHAWIWLRAMYAFFRFSTGLRTSRLPDYGARFIGRGFQVVRRQSWRWGLIVSELWERPDTIRS